MNKNMLGVVLLMSVGVGSVALHAGGDTEQYAFSDFDKNVFTNHATGKVELVYPTQLVKSVERNFITINKGDLEALIYPALTRIVYKQRQLALRRCNDHSWLAETLAQKEELKCYWDKENAHSTQLKEVYTEVKGLELLTTSSDSNIKIPTDELMLVVQYAAQKIKYWHSGTVGIIVSHGDERQQTFAYGQFAELLEKHKAHVQQ